MSLGFVISALGWIFCVVSFILRRLNGLEAMFVVQFSWLTFLWLNSKFTLAFQNTWALKYSTGFNYPFSGVTEQKSETAPYTYQFKLSDISFISNFNLIIILQIGALIAVIVTYLRLKKF